VTWLLKLYPPRWRRRYGEELTELLAAQPFSIGVAVDLTAGAIDAWLHPQLIVPAMPDVKGDASMIARIMRFECAGYGPDVTTSDKIKSATVNIGGTLVLALLWLWARWRFGRNDYLTALAPMAYLLPYLVSLHYTSLKRRSDRAQMILIVGLGVVLAAFLLLVGWIATKI
jgi:hypothetical protein